MYTLLKQLIEEKNIKYSGGIYHKTQVLFAFNTNRIEGSKLSEEQTRYIFETNSLISSEDKSTNIDDIIETKNHFKLFDAMLTVAALPLSEDMIKEFHRILKQGTNQETISWFKVGDYKAVPNEVGGISTTDPNNVSAEMDKLLESYDKIENIVLEDIVDFHYRFERIHPFQDGNGRVGRIIMFKECLKNNILPFVIEDRNKAFYYRGLSEYQKEIGYLLDTCKDAQDKYENLSKHLIVSKSISIEPPPFEY